MDTIGKHFRTLTAKAFASHGFHEAEVLSRWPEIVGEDIAKLCTPERLKWSAPNQDEKPTAILHLRTAPGRAMELQYAESRIIERINTYLGYGAISRLKFKSGVGVPVASKPSPHYPTPIVELKGIEDADLKAALARLAAGVFTSPAGSPQAK